VTDREKRIWGLYALGAVVAAAAHFDRGLLGLWLDIMALLMFCGGLYMNRSRYQ